MKKIAALLLVFVMLLSFCGCNSKKLTAKKLLGRWETEISAEIYLSISDNDISEVLKNNELPNSVAKKINDIKLKAVFEFDKKKGNFKISEQSIKYFFNQVMEIILDYYKNGGLIKAVQDQGIEITTNEELDEIYKKQGTSIDSVLSEMKTEMEKIMNDYIDKLMLGEFNDGYYPLYLKNVNYKISEDAVIFYDGDDEYEKYYFEVIDKETLKINQIYYNYEEFNVSMTLKRIK